MRTFTEEPPRYAGTRPIGTRTEREASARVRDAYHGWDSAVREDAESAFAEYLVALDQEEHASLTYARLVTVMDPLSARADAQSEIGMPTERVTDERSND